MSITLLHGTPASDAACFAASEGVRRVLVVGLPGHVDHEASLPERVDQLLNELEPELVVWEHVRGFLGKRRIEAFHQRLDLLRSHGYVHISRVLDAVSFGAPVSQKRLWVVASRWTGGDLPEPPRLPRRPPRYVFAPGADPTLLAILEANL